MITSSARSHTGAVGSGCSRRIYYKPARLTMNHETAVANAKGLADRVLAPAARRNDKEARFSSEAVTALGSAGLLGMMLPAEMGGAALGPRTFAAVVATLAEADGAVGAVSLMHVFAPATLP